MARKGNGNKPATKEWAKHLRKAGKRDANKRQRKANKSLDN